MCTLWLILICYDFVELCAISIEKTQEEPKEEKCEQKTETVNQKEDKYGNNWPRWALNT